MSFKRTFGLALGLGLSLLLAAHTTTSAEPEKANEAPKPASERLQKQLEVLRKQNLLGKGGKSLERRYEKLNERAEQAFLKGEFERSSILYYTIVENPEFEGIGNKDEMEFRLIRSLYHSKEDYTALYYIDRTFRERGVRTSHFLEIFRIFVDILNRVRDWNEVEPALATLQKQSKTLPAAIREEANYLFGRMAFFKNDLEQAQTIFKSISGTSRFHSRSLYHLGVLAAMKGDLLGSERYFEEALAASERDEDFQISKAKDAQKSIRVQKSIFRDLCLLALGRLRDAQGRDAQITGIPEDSPLFPSALFENAWFHFHRRRYKESLQILESFFIRFPQHELIPEVILLNGHAQLEAGRPVLAVKEFRRFMEKYEGQIKMLDFVSRQKDPLQAYKDFENNPEIAARPELKAWAFQGPRLESVRRSLATISAEQEDVLSSQKEWESLRALIMEDGRVVFPGTSKIRPHGGATARDSQRTDQERKLHELERIEAELQRRVADLEEALKKATAQKSGRKKELEESVRIERERLDRLQQKSKEMRSQIMASGKSAKPVKTSKEEAELRRRLGVNAFGELIQEETDLLPIIQKSLEEKRGDFRLVSARIVQFRIGELGRQLDEWVRQAYLGEIEVAFVKAEQATQEAQQSADRRVLVQLIHRFLKKYPSAPEVPDQMFRLAEVSYDESKQAFFDRQKEFDDAYEAHLAGRSKTPPKEPKVNLAESIGICRKILHDFQKYPRRDRVLYVLGYYLEEQDLKKDSIAAFQQLIDEFPQSEFAVEGFMRLGENYFDLEKFKQAVTYYEKILKRPDSIFYELAIYKIAWSYYRLGEYQESIRYFSDLIALGRGDAEKQRKGKDLEDERQRRLQDLHKEAIVYLALAFSEAGGPRAAIAHLQKRNLGRYTVEVLRRLCDVYHQQLRYAEAIEATQIYLQYAPFDPEGPKVQARVIEAYEKLGNTEGAFRERQKLHELFGPRSAWAQRNKKNVGAVQEAYKLVQEALIYNATLFHEKAQREASEKGSQAEARAAYLLAIEAYKRYLWDFDKGAQAYEMRFNYAECLYEVGDFENAAYQYQKVAEANTKDGKFLKEAAFNTVLSYESLLKKAKSDTEEASESTISIQVPDEKEGASARQRGPKRALTQQERGLIDAYDHYALWVPQGEKVPETSFKAAKQYFQVEDYDPAVKRFGKFYERYPQHRLAPSAVHHILVSHMNTRNWTAAETWARHVLNQPTLVAHFTKADLEKLLGASMFYQAEALKAKGDLKQATTKYLAIDEEWKGNPMAAPALFQAAAIYEEEKQDALATQTLEKLVARYPKSDLAPKAMFHVGKTYEKNLDFEKAAKAFERLVREYPSSENAQDALYNAGSFYELLGLDDAAGRNYLLYAQKFPTKEDAKVIHFLAAKSYQRAGDAQKASQLYREQLDRWDPTPDRAIECHMRLAEIYRGQERWKESYKQIRKAANLYQKHHDTLTLEGRNYAGKALFLLAEDEYLQFELVKLRSSPGRLARDLEEKAKRLERANEAYFRVVDVGHPEWAIAALYKVGRTFQTFSEALYKAPKPQGLSKKDRELYQQQLEEQAFPIEDKAIEAYEKALKKAHELNSYGEWSERIVRQLESYKPTQYPPLLERLPTVAFAPTEEGNALLRQADTYLQQKKWLQAANFYEYALREKKVSRLASVYHHLAICEWEQKNTVKAVSLWEKAQIAEANFTEPHTYLGRIALVSGDFARAEGNLRKALQGRSNDAIAHLDLGVLLRAKGDLQGAKAQFEEAIRLNPKLPEAQLNLAILYKKFLNDAAQAEAHFARFALLDPKGAKEREWEALFGRTTKKGAP